MDSGEFLPRRLLVGISTPQSELSLYFQNIFKHVNLPKEKEKLFGKIYLTEEEIIKSIGEFAKTGKICIDLDEILGEGGEGLVVEQDQIFMEMVQKCAIKFTHYQTNGQISGSDFFDLLKMSKEFVIGTWELNEFRIKHLLNTIVQLHGETFHVTSKLLFYKNIFAKFFLLTFSNSKV